MTTAKKESDGQFETDNEELIDTLIAISVIAKRMAGRFRSQLEQQRPMKTSWEQEKGGQKYVC